MNRSGTADGSEGAHDVMALKTRWIPEFLEYLTLLHSRDMPGSIFQAEIL